MYKPMFVWMMNPMIILINPYILLVNSKFKMAAFETSKNHIN